MLGTGAKKGNSNYCVFVAVTLLLSCLCVNSWGACVNLSIPYSGDRANSNYVRCWYGGACTSQTLCSSLGLPSCTGNGCPSTFFYNSYYYTSVNSDNRFDYCTNDSYPNECRVISTNSSDITRCFYNVRCTTQAEADSVTASLQPQQRDTTLFACSESLVDGRPQSTLYSLSCKALDGVVTSCNGKTDVSITEDGTPFKTMSGTCAQNGYSNGVYGGSSTEDSTAAPTANADCFAITGSTCHMRDKFSGNTFTCACDGDCNYALNSLMAGTADCSNPYPQPTSASDSLDFSSPSSSGSGESSPSSSGSGESSPSDSTEDFEYDYTAVLEAIRANTQYTGNAVEDVSYKLNTTNDYLHQIANKDFSPTINVSPTPVTFNADTAKSGYDILQLLNAERIATPQLDTAGTGAEFNGLLSKIDSVRNEGLPNMSDSIEGAVTDYKGAYNAFKDSLEGSAWADSTNRWKGLLLNNGVISGNGSNNCPAVLNRKWEVNFGSVHTEWGPLGKYLCTNVFGGLTGWALARIVLRCLVSIFSMIWLFKAVMGIDGSGGDEN